VFKVLSSTEELDMGAAQATRAPPGAEALHRKCGVYTRPEIVEHILDSIGWTVDADLSDASLLEPAAGDGAFVTAAASRLLSSMRRMKRPVTIATLADRIRAFEIHPREARRARQRLAGVLSDAALPTRLCKALVARWITTGDFLLTNLEERSFSHVAGNPPYARWSKIPISLRRKYEQHLPQRMIKGDLFLPFLDLSIGYLVLGGRLGFVCSDRWRFMAFAKGFRDEWLPKTVIERDESLSAATAYIRAVDVYPSVLVIRREWRSSPMRRANDRSTNLRLVDCGYEIRVGPALGWKPAYVLEPEEDNVEPELLASWVDASDIHEGGIRSSGRRVIALHDDNGRLRTLSDYPRAAARLQRHRKRLKERAIVRAGAVWYRPIDRVIVADWARPKVVLPEMAKMPRVAIDVSGAIPSHGVYAIFAPDDDVEKLYESLRNGGLAKALEGIAPKVKGGYVRCYRRFLEQVVI
jgi:hypothetical protein